MPKERLMTTDVRTINENAIDFNVVNREIIVPVDSSRLSELNDIRIQLYSSPSVHPIVASALLSNGEDFRLYVNEHNLTHYYVAQIQTNLSMIDHEVIKKQYLTGALAYIKLLPYIQLSEEAILAEKSKAEAIAQDENWDLKFSKFGDINTGRSGNLHLCNFVYKYITMEPISLAEVWREYRLNQEGGETLPERLKDFEQINLTFSQGPSPTYEDEMPDAGFPTGRLSYIVEQLHTNPLEQPLRQINFQLKGLKKLVENNRINYLMPIKATVETTQDDVKVSMAEQGTRIERLIHSVKSIG